MKKVIELLEGAYKNHTINNFDFVNDCLQKAIDILQNPKPITPEQFREIEGEEYPEDGAVYLGFKRPSATEIQRWEVVTYREAKYRFKDFRGARRTEDFTYPEIIVCAYNLKGPPARDWRAE
jgi:hypothetical protein